PGAPAVTVAAEYLADTKQLRVSVKQTQPGEAFQFPLPFAFYAEGSSQPVPLTLDVTEKEHVAFVALPGRPRMILVDPQQTVLMDLHEDKGRDLWAAQLRESPTLAPRLRAARHFGESKRPEDRELLAAALAEEKFWGGQVVLARALGESGG